MIPPSTYHQLLFLAYTTTTMTQLQDWHVGYSSFQGAGLQNWTQSLVTPILVMPSFKGW